MAERLAPEALAAIRARCERESLANDLHIAYELARGENLTSSRAPWLAVAAVARTDVPALLDHVAALEEIIRDVARSGVELEDPRVGYVTIQLDRDTWEQARALLTEPTR